MALDPGRIRAARSLDVMRASCLPRWECSSDRRTVEERERKSTARASGFPGRTSGRGWLPALVPACPHPGSPPRPPDAREGAVTADRASAFLHFNRTRRFKRKLAGETPSLASAGRGEGSGGGNDSAVRPERPLLAEALALNRPRDARPRAAAESAARCRRAGAATGGSAAGSPAPPARPESGAPQLSSVGCESGSSCLIRCELRAEIPRGACRPTNGRQTG